MIKDIGFGGRGSGFISLILLFKRLRYFYFFFCISVFLFIKTLKGYCGDYMLIK